MDSRIQIEYCHTYNRVGTLRRPTLYFSSNSAWNNSLIMSAVCVQSHSLLIVLWVLWEIQHFPFTVSLFWHEWNQIRMKSGGPFDYIFPLDYFYSHNTAHWQNCSPLLYFRPLIFCFLFGLAEQAQPSLRPPRPTTFPTPQQCILFLHCPFRSLSFILTVSIYFFNNIIYPYNAYIETLKRHLLLPTTEMWTYTFLEYLV